MYYDVSLRNYLSDLFNLVLNTWPQSLLHLRNAELTVGCNLDTLIFQYIVMINGVRPDKGELLVYFHCLSIGCITFIEF